MRKTTLSLLLALALLLCGCGAPAQAPEPEAVPAPTPEVTPQPTPEVTPQPTPEPTSAPDPVETARELIRAGRYADAAELLATLPESEETAALSLRAALGDPREGDSVLFGRYEQDNRTDNGAEDIEWIVLAREGDQLLLLSRCALDSMPYHDVHYGPTTWKDCALRAWLNSEFLEAAFTGAEQKLLVEATLSNPDNPAYHTPGGEDTVDRVFLLSYAEARTYVVGTKNAFARVTDYATARGGSHIYDGMGWWWLRSPGTKVYNACHIDNHGTLSLYGYIASRPHWVVRPAIWLELGV